MQLLATDWTWRRSPTDGTTRLSARQVEQFTDSDDDFLRCAHFPTEIHRELLAAGLIADPFVSDKEESVQWVGEASWLFRSTFEHNHSKEGTTELVFGGLDTFATVWLDGEIILETDNGFLCDQRVDVTRLVTGEHRRHVVLIQFQSAYLHGKDLQANSEFKVKAWNGDPSRCHVRKPQYHWGWDWGPTLMTCGPTGTIRLETYTCRIADFYPRGVVDKDLRARILVDGELVGDRRRVSHAFARIISPTGAIHDVILSLKHGALSAELDITKPALWWPANMGSQPLYAVELIVLDAKGRVLTADKRKIGLRRSRLLEEAVKDEPGTSFLLEINGVPLFGGGSNWIPADSFLTSVTPECHRAWLELARDGHQNTVRVWGGGIYESDIFYDLCDELGLLVWQDIPFACGLYPAGDTFCASVKREAEVNVKRLRHHPSLVLLCGNNEDYQIAEAEGVYDSDSDKYAKTFPARKIYEHLLPDIVSRLTDGAVLYRPGAHIVGSAGPARHGRAATREIPSEAMAIRCVALPYQDWDKLLVRFASEWGMQGYPDIRTIDHWLDGTKEDRFPQSRLIAAHQKADGGERRLAIYLEENFRHGNTLEDYVYTTQLMQADCVRMAVQTWRRQFRGPGAYGCSGSLVWQLNDCWPVISWSIVDCYLRPKAAYYTMKRALAPIALGSRRTTGREYVDDRSAAHYLDTTTIAVWLSNTSREATAEGLEAELCVVDIRTAEVVDRQTLDVGRIEAMSCTEVAPLSYGAELARRIARDCAVGVKVIDRASGTVLARLVDWPEPFKYLHFPSAEETQLAVSLDEAAKVIRIVAKRCVKGLIFSVDSDDVRLEDNALDLMPDQPQVVGYTGNLKRGQLSWRHLYDRD